MDISSGLIAKGTAGALAASAAVGGGVMAGTDWLDGLWPGSGVSNDVAEIREDVQSTLDVQGSGDSHREPQDPETTPRPEGSEVAENGNLSGGGGQDGNLQGGPKTSTSNPESVDLPSGTGSGNNLGDSLEAPRSSQQTNDQAAKAQGSTGGNGNKRKQEAKLTNWDSALINYLKEGETNNRDIVFSVKTGKTPAEVDLTTAFPDFENDTSKKRLTITATVTTSNTNLKGNDHSTKITEFKEMNEGKDWTWECKIELSKEKKENTINLENKEKLIGTDGFFNKLAGTGEKDLKIKFIENCAKARGKNSSTALTNEKISVEKAFDLVKKDDETSWKIKDDDYNAWFSTTLIQQA